VVQRRNAGGPNTNLGLRLFLKLDGEIFGVDFLRFAVDDLAASVLESHHRQQAHEPLLEVDGPAIPEVVEGINLDVIDDPNFGTSFRESLDYK